MLQGSSFDPPRVVGILAQHLAPNTWRWPISCFFPENHLAGIWPGWWHVQQMVWMHNWLDEVEVDYYVPGLIRGDNQGAIALTKNTKDYGKVKHIDIWHHCIQELLQSKAIIIKQASSVDNLTDLFTKSLPHDHHHHILSTLSICWALLHSWGSVKLCPESAPDTRYLLFCSSIILFFISLSPWLPYKSHPFSLIPLLYYMFIIVCITYSQSFLLHPTESKSSIPLPDFTPLLISFLTVTFHSQ